VSLRTRIVASAALATAGFPTLVAVKGTDVFTVVDLSGTNDPVSAGLMLKFIDRVAKLR
jgi:hypothetical protein